MDSTTHSARITEPVRYVAMNGRNHKIPVGPCLVEGLGTPESTVIWGTRGQSSAVLPTATIAEAQRSGQLVLLD